MEGGGGGGGGGAKKQGRNQGTKAACNNSNFYDGGRKGKEKEQRGERVKACVGEKIFRRIFFPFFFLGGNILLLCGGEETGRERGGAFCLVGQGEEGGGEGGNANWRERRKKDKGVGHTHARRHSLDGAKKKNEALLFLPRFFTGSRINLNLIHSFLFLLSFRRGTFNPLKKRFRDRSKEINYREEEKKILDSVMGVDVYDKRIRPSGLNSTGELDVQVVNGNLYRRLFILLS